MAMSRRNVRALIRLAVLLAFVLLPTALYAQQSPLERAALNLEATFTGPLARSLALVAIVVGDLMFMFGEGGAKRQISGIVWRIHHNQAASGAVLSSKRTMSRPGERS